MDSAEQTQKQNELLSRVLAIYGGLNKLRLTDVIYAEKLKLEERIAALLNAQGALTESTEVISSESPCEALDKGLRYLEQAIACFKEQHTILTDDHRRRKEDALSVAHPVIVTLLNLSPGVGRVPEHLENWCLYQLAQLFVGFDAKHPNEPSWSCLLTFLKERTLLETFDLHGLSNGDQIRKRVERLKFLFADKGLALKPL